MKHFTIRDIENLCGIKAHTLRVWEQRYGIINPKRKESKHRLYDTEDLKLILRIAHLYHNGYKISRIAAMSIDEMRRNTLEAKYRGNYESLVNQLMEASIDMDEDQFRNIMDHVVGSLGMEKAMVQVIYPFLGKVGLLWMTDNVIPAQEHFASNLIRNRIYRSIDELPPIGADNKDRTVLLCPPGEYHEIPLLFIQYLHLKNGKRCVNFGCDTHAEVVTAYLRRNEVRTILVHLITNFTQQTPDEYLMDLLEDFPGINIVASGPVFQQSGINNARLSYLRSLEEMLHYVRSAP